MRRIEQVNELLLHTLAPAVRGLESIPPGVLVTITRVDVSPDLADARVYYSAWPETAREEVARILPGVAGHLRSMVAHETTLRHTPHLTFHYDSELDVREAFESALVPPSVD